MTIMTLLTVKVLLMHYKKTLKHNLMQIGCEKLTTGKTGTTNFKMDVSEPKSTPKSKL